ncbi:hypothetical protein L6452_37679 [Arctium lappa]|uniref:Uncharacterized protein n=1 Tax=Arctium lappa TaxID=4217 RepID=A0ACB8Y7T3_ARCLA|nr:hypothetical protein L6452_37679 [Arctium lappa]
MWRLFKTHGGLTVQLEFNTNKDTIDFMNNAESSWKVWFSSMSRWNQEVAINKRLALLDIYGLPIHTWYPEVFSEISKIWGEVVMMRINGINTEFGCLGIITNKEVWIMETISIKVEDQNFKVRVMEKVLEHLDLGENRYDKSSSLEEVLEKEIGTIGRR